MLIKTLILSLLLLLIFNMKKIFDFFKKVDFVKPSQERWRNIINGRSIYLSIINSKNVFMGNLLINLNLDNEFNHASAFKSFIFKNEEKLINDFYFEKYNDNFFVILNKENKQNPIIIENSESKEIKNCEIGDVFLILNHKENKTNIIFSCQNM